MDFSLVGVAIVNALPYVLGGAGALVFLNWYFKNPDSKYTKYVPFVIQAVKFAESKIPDGTPNKSAAKVDAFLKEFTSLYEKSAKSTMPEAVKEWALRVKEIALLEVEKSKNQVK
jgi:hypothetical protein